MNEWNSDAIDNKVQSLANFGIWEWNIVTDIWYVSEQWKLIHGADKIQLTKDELMKLAHPDDIEIVNQAFDDAKDNNKPYDVIHRIITYDTKQIRYVHAVGYLKLDPVTQEPVGLYGTTQDITEQKLTEIALQESEARFNILFDSIPSVAIQGYDQNGIARFWNKASEKIYGYSSSEAIGKSLLELIIPEKMQKIVRKEMEKMFKTTIPIPASEMVLKRKDNTPVDVFSSHAYVQVPHKPPEMFCVDIDITRQKQAERDLHLAASVFSTAREGIMITDTNGTIIDVNDAFTQITGYEHDDVIGKNPRILKSGRQDAEFYSALWRDLRDKEHWYGELWNRKKDGELYAEMQTISTVRDPATDSVYYVSLFSDITSIKKHQDQLEHLAHYDSLTQLPNRVLLVDRIRQAMAHTRRHDDKMAVVFLDLDGFKTINDSYGHVTGDAVLVELGKRMSNSLREGDTLARVGGDEFVVVLGELCANNNYETLLDRLLQSASTVLEINGLELKVSASMGVTFYPQNDDLDADQLQRQADQAMYQAKLAGKNCYYVFDAEHDRNMRGKNDRIERIRSALANQEFVMYYQPKVNLRTGEVVGAEALIRWNHPELGILPPANFLPEIENHPLSVELGEWVIDTVLTQQELWKANGLDLPMSVNVGARQLQQPNFTERLHMLLLKHGGIKPGDLELEVLETSALDDLAQVSKVIAACRNWGISLTLDDFGTGYSSLIYLKRLAVAGLKIDQSFVRDMLEDPDDLAILEGVIGLADAFNRSIIAEGVESLEHGKLLIQLGCDFAQGYGISHPMPADQIPRWTESWKTPDEWSECPAYDHNHKPLLHAIVEHRVWVDAVIHYVNSDNMQIPELDHEQCGIGRWLIGKQKHAIPLSDLVIALDKIHLRMHELAKELCHLKSNGERRLAIQRLPELYEIKQQFSNQVKLLGPSDITA